MGYFGDNGRKLGVDIVQVEYIRLELIEQSGELCPDFTGAEWAAQRLDYSQPGGECNLARKVFAPGSFQIFRMLHGKNGYFMAFLFQKLF